MTKRIRFWSMDKFCLMCAKMLLNKFDAVLVIEGNRGLGKSTLAIHIANKISRIMRKIAKETGGKDSLYYNHYRFSPKQQSKGNGEYVIYNQQDVLDFMDKWNSTAISDEQILVSFNRDFHQKGNKDFIRLMNTNRDHCNLLIMCIPQFQVLDNQIKNLCKIRITVARRGVSVIQTPNRTIYGRDKWDTANNEKIEREWLKKGSGMPQYSRLNTFRGMMRFPPLKENEQKIYDSIKINERNDIKGDLGIGAGEKKKSEDMVDIALERLKEGKIRNNHILDGLAIAKGVSPDNFKNQIRNRLKKEGVSHKLTQYYWDNPKAKKEEIMKL